jgi:hypothetical protein
LLPLSQEVLTASLQAEEVLGEVVDRPALLAEEGEEVVEVEACCRDTNNGWCKQGVGMGWK